MERRKSRVCSKETRSDSGLGVSFVCLCEQYGTVETGMGQYVIEANTRAEGGACASGANAGNWVGRYRGGRGLG